MAQLAPIAHLSLELDGYDFSAPAVLQDLDYYPGPRHSRVADAGLPISHQEDIGKLDELPFLGLQPLYLECVAGPGHILFAPAANNSVDGSSLSLAGDIPAVVWPLSSHSGWL